MWCKSTTTLSGFRAESSIIAFTATLSSIPKDFLIGLPSDIVYGVLYLITAIKSPFCDGELVSSSITLHRVTVLDGISQNNSIYLETTKGTESKGNIIIRSMPTKCFLY